MTKTLLRFREVAQVLGVSIDKARQIARTDPMFPAVVPLGPRTNLVPEADLRRYIESKRSSSKAA
jgi:predicted DNA-binding transcriptional regulator AlpA